MKNILSVLFVLLLFGLPLSLMATEDKPSPSPLAPLLETFDPTVARRVTDPLRENPVARPEAPPERRTPEFPTRPGQRTPESEHQRAVQTLQRIAQEAQRTGNPLARELQNAMQELQRATRTALTQTPPPAPPVVRTSLNAALNAERERAYIELARQYFFVFASTPVAVSDPSQAAANEFVVTRNVIDINEEGEEVERVIQEVVMVPEEDESEPEKSDREKILDNFVECVKKISPAAQITLLSELIRSAHTNDELKLLESLLDTVVQPAADRTSGVRQANAPGRPEQGLPMAPISRSR